MRRIRPASTAPTPTAADPQPARRQPGFVGDAKDVLLEIYAADAEFSADVLEEIYARLDDFSERVLRASVTDEEAGAVLTQIAKEEDLAGHIRRNLMDTRRAVSFLMRKRLLNAEQNEDARQILRDIGSLEGHTDFLFDKLNFLMDATVGFININQNKIIKIFSVASVALPFWYFHHKGWLKWRASRGVMSGSTGSAQPERRGRVLKDQNGSGQSRLYRAPGALVGAYQQTPRGAE